MLLEPACNLLLVLRPDVLERKFPHKIVGMASIASPAQGQNLAGATVLLLSRCVSRTFLQRPLQPVDVGEVAAGLL